MSSVNLNGPAWWEIFYDLDKARFEGNGTAKRQLEQQIKSQARNVNPYASPGDVYLDKSPTGNYIFIGDHVAISGEAYAAMKKARYAEIGDMIERGDSLSAKGVSYDEYANYMAAHFASSQQWVYDFLCYEGKSRAYFVEKANAEFERWVEGEDYSGPRKLDQ